jgi:hypothetical protein
VEDRGLPPPTTAEYLHLLDVYTPMTSRQYLPETVQRALVTLSLIDPATDDLTVARVAPILEPLKVRLITAMDALRAYIATPLQKSLWKHLQTFPVFALTGTPVSDSLVHSLVHREGKNDPRSFWVSGDYSAATDNLDLRLTKVFLEAVLEVLPKDTDPRVLTALRASLYEQIIVYPSWTRLPPIIQRNGQLMGSVLSFPFLCLANLFGYVMSRPDRDELLCSSAKLRNLPCLINGDDILFRSDEAHYKEWCYQVSRVGFSLSVGKNFTHPRFFTVNSVPIEYVPTPRTVSPNWMNWSWGDDAGPVGPYHLNEEPIIRIGGFLNVGLLTGQAKLTGRDALGALPLSGWHSGAVMSAANPKMAHGWFIHYHKREIHSQTRYTGKTLNLFAHPLLGGLGFQVPPGVETRFSPFQRRLAHALWVSALSTFEGAPQDYDLSSLLVLETPESSTRILGRKIQRVTVQLYPVGSPFPEGFTSFVDDSALTPLPMVVSTAVPDPDVSMRSRCRLSNARLKELAKMYGPMIPLHPLDQMTTFPFLPARVETVVVDRTKGPNKSKVFTKRSTSTVYVPLCPLQDISTTDPGEPLPSVTTEPADWELDQFLPLIPRWTQDLNQELLFRTSLPNQGLAYTRPGPRKSNVGRRRRTQKKADYLRATGFIMQE